MKQNTINEHIIKASHPNTVINDFMSGHIYDWTNYCEYHCQKQKTIHPASKHPDDFHIEILGLSIDSMLQMKEEDILSLHKKEAGSDLSPLEYWVLSDIKNRVIEVYSRS